MRKKIAAYVLATAALATPWLLDAAQAQPGTSSGVTLAKCIDHKSFVAPETAPTIAKVAPAPTAGRTIVLVCGGSGGGGTAGHPEWRRPRPR